VVLKGLFPLVAASVATFAIGCAPIAGPVVVEAVVPVPGDAGGVGIGDVTLERILDLRTGRGRDFDVRGDFKVNATDFQDLSGSFDDVVARIRRGGGSDIEPHMSSDGTRFLADDWETLYYFTLTANFEAAFAFARESGDTSRASSDADDERALVGLFASIVLNDFVPLPLISSDNAAYAPPVDGWLALRTAFQEGVPFGMHRGVIAHEFGHRLFFHNAFSSVDGGFEVWQADNSAPAEDAAAIRAPMLLKGIDEGLADVFAIAALSDKDAINAAFAGAGELFADEAIRRDVEGPFADAATYDNLRTLTLDAGQLQSCNLSTAEFGASFNFYCVGTVVAAALWEGAGNDAAVLRTEIEPAVIAALPKVGEALVNGVAFDLDLFLEPLAQTVSPGARRDALCAAYARRFESLVVAGRIPTCS
jgi:hypothetical protein